MLPQRLALASLPRCKAAIRRERASCSSSDRAGTMGVKLLAQRVSDGTELGGGGAAVFDHHREITGQRSAQDLGPRVRAPTFSRVS